MDSHTTQLELLALTADLESYINAKLRHLRKLILSSQVEVQVNSDRQIQDCQQNGCLLPAQSSSLDTQPPSSSSLNVGSSSSSSSSSTSASSSSLTEVQPPVALIKPPVAPTSAQEEVPVTELTSPHNQAVQEVPKQQQQQQNGGPTSNSLQPKEALFNVRAFIAAERLIESGHFNYRLSLANLPSLLKVGQPSPTRFHCIHISSVSHFVLVAEGVTEQLVTDMSRFYRTNTSECNTFKDDDSTQAVHLKPGSLVVFALGRSTPFFFRGLVLPQEPKNAKVVQLYAVDLGFVVSAPAGDLRPLVESLFSLDQFPLTAVRAGLEGVLPVDYRPGSGGEPKWPPTATETLKELVLNDQKVGLEVTASRLNEDGSFAVDLIFQSGGQSQQATQVLKRFKLAKAAV